MKPSRFKTALFALASALVTALSLTAQTRLIPQTLSLKSGKTFTLKVAEGFEIVPAAEGMQYVGTRRDDLVPTRPRGTTLPPLKAVA